MEKESDSMVKIVLSHQVLPGKYAELVKWFKSADNTRKEKDKEYQAPKRYINQFGDAFRIYVEFVLDELPSDFMTYGTTDQPEFFSLIIPGSTEVNVLKEIA